MKEIRTRIAPAPTGYFHLGVARTALFNSQMKITSWRRSNSGSN
ncbi:hypothetical protein J7K91_00800, partial [bacterium]|nr:hypothetical protein [bacterium]